MVDHQAIFSFKSLCYVSGGLTHFFVMLRNSSRSKKAMEVKMGSFGFLERDAEGFRRVEIKLYTTFMEIKIVVKRSKKDTKSVTNLKNVICLLNILYKQKNVINFINDVILTMEVFTLCGNVLQHRLHFPIKKLALGIKIWLMQNFGSNVGKDNLNIFKIGTKIADFDITE
ncbi:hypothetical protein ACJX0J_018869 [Zea mays]